MNQQHEGVALIISDTDKQIFYLQEKDQHYQFENYRGAYSFFGGKQEQGETPDNALQRELLEELPNETANLLFQVSTPFKTFTLQSQGKPYILHTYSAILLPDHLRELSSQKVKEGNGVLKTRSESITGPFVHSLEEVIVSYLTRGVVSYQEMQRRWNTTLSKLQLEDKTNHFSSLLKQYTSSNRHYHNLEHIRFCLDELETVRHLTTYPNLLAFALWNHDYYYDTWRTDNELRSARKNSEVLSQLGVNAILTRYTHDVIMATKPRYVVPFFDARLCADIDMSVLGQNEELFREYETNIQKEYSWLPAELYFERRKIFLESLLKQKNIFQTKHYRENYEDKARKNLLRGLERISSFMMN